MKIGELWKRAGERKGIKLRWMDWGHSHKWFEVHSYDEKTDTLSGKLDCGESISFTGTTPHWKIYEEGDEHHAKAC